MAASQQRPIERAVRSEVVLVTGASSCLGQHIMQQLHDYEHVASIRTFDSARPFHKKLDYKEHVPVAVFSGSLQDRTLLSDVLHNVTTVLHLQEHVDVAINPDAGRMRRMNVDDTESLLRACLNTPSVRYFVLGSSYFVNVSNTWPSVANPEMAKLPPPKEWPFPAYCATKLAAEQLIFDLHKPADRRGHLQTAIVRLSPIWGELDESSPIADLLSYAHKRNADCVPIIGDAGGVLQLTYAGNVAHGVLVLLRRMRDDSMLNGEIVFLLDDTPIVSIYKLLEPFVAAARMKLVQSAVPFLVFYWAYRALESLGSVLPDSWQRWPCADYFYLAMYHWVFFNDVRARTYLGYKPKFTHQQAVQRARPYYEKFAKCC